MPSPRPDATPDHSHEPQEKRSPEPKNKIFFKVGLCLIRICKKPEIEKFHVLSVFSGLFCKNN